jgi:hypothetical protein
VRHSVVEKLEVTESKFSGVETVRADLQAELGPVEERRRSGIGTVPRAGEGSVDNVDGLAECCAGLCDIEADIDLGWSRFLDVGDHGVGCSCERPT